MVRTPTPRALNAFRHTVLAGSVTGAASALGRTQPAVSRLLRELESEVGFSLFERIKGRLLLTPEGRHFFEELQRTFLGLDRLSVVAAEIRQGRRGSLRVAAMPAAAASFVPAALIGFKQEFPGTSVELLALSSAEIARLVQTQDCDLGIVEGSLVTSSLTVTRAYSARCAIIGPAEPANRRPRRAGLKELDGKPFVALSAERSSLGSQLAALLQRDGIEVQITATTHLSSVVSALVLQGLGLGVVDELTAVVHAARGGSARLLDAPIQMQLCVVQSEGSPSSEVVRRFGWHCERAIATHKIR
jgi:DNA-binding transcriptional LysR family regulator